MLTMTSNEQSQMMKTDQYLTGSKLKNDWSIEESIVQIKCLYGDGHLN